MAKAEPVSYTVKTISFMNRRVPIMMQNQNGPCPLLALANILLLRNQIQLSPDAPSVTQDRLISLVAGHLLDSNSSDRLAHMDEDYRANTQQNVADAIAQLPKLATGIDVNVTFTSIRGFEFTQETVIFDLLDVRLLHGWLVDPKEGEVAAPIAQHSYNELVSLIVDRLGDEATPQLKSAASFRSAAPEAQKIEGAPISEGTYTRDLSPDLDSPSNLPGEGRHAQEQGEKDGIKASDAASSQYGSLPESEQGVKAKSEEEENLEKAIALSLMETSFLPEAEQSQPAASLRQQDEPDSHNSVEHKASEISPSSGEQAPEINPAQQSSPEEAMQALILEDKSRSSSSRDKSSTEPLSIQQDLTDHDRGKPSHDAKDTSLAPGPSGRCNAMHYNEELPKSAMYDEPSSSGTSQEASKSRRQEVSHYPVEHTAGALAKGKGAAAPISPPLHSPAEEDSTCDYPHPLTEREELDKSARRAEEMHQAMLVQSFLNRTSSQLTEHGLLELHKGMRPNELGILFRNNHFNVIFAHKEGVWVLATDQGYQFEEVVWERLRDVHGNNEFVRADFSCPYSGGQDALKDAAIAAGGKPSADADLALALQMQEEENERQARFIADQQAQQPSYSQMAAKQAKDAAPAAKDGQLAKDGAAKMGAGRKGRPGSEKSDAWKFWKW